MAENEEYELLPYEELEELRRELKEIKRNPLKGYEKADDLKTSIDSLNQTMQDLIKLFSETNDELIKNFEKDSIEKHFEIISSQNEKIAKGILAVAELITKKNPVKTETKQETKISNEENNEDDEPKNINPPNQTHPLNSNNLENKFDKELPEIPETNQPMNEPVINQAIPPEMNGEQTGLDNKQVIPPNNIENNTQLPPLGMDLPPPPKKKGLLGLFK